MAWELVGNIKGPQGEKGDAGDDATVVVDAALSGESENPVQNKVIKAALDGKAASEHVHTVSDISDFPESMPASDVSAWAKAPEKPAYTATEVGAAEASHIHADATTSAAGFMSAADKAKLDGIEEGATKLEIDSTLKLEEGRLSVVRPVPDSGTYGAYLENTEDGPAWAVFQTATTSQAGLLSPEDKAKIDASQNLVTQSRNGLMRMEDKTKLDGIESGANNFALPSGGTVGQVLTKTASGEEWQTPATVTVDAALDDASTNPVQNKVVKAALDEKADISDPTFTGDVTIQGESMSDGKLRLLSNGKQLDIGVALGGMASISLRDQEAIDSDIVVYFSETGLTMTKPLSVSSGGTGANTASSAREALGITPTNIGAAAEEHSHAASDITSGELSASRLPTVPIAKGGTGATTAEAARTALEITPTNIGAAAANHTHADYQTEAQVEAIVNEKLGSVYKYKGSVANFEALPVADNVEGDVYNCEDTGMNYAWDGTAWDALGAASTLSDLGVTATAEELNYLDGVTSNIQTQIDGKASSIHTHTVSQISDFPASMPASDVSAWAKAETKPTYTAAEVGAAEDDHVHTVSQITDFPESMPASDVYSWAKAAQKPSYTYTEVGAAASTHTHSTATTSANGFMSAADKTKLDGIAEGADALPTGGTAGQFLAKTEDGMIWQDVNIPTVSVASDEDFKAYMGIS